jgi:AspT/YidE/YbjL antiporter-like protein
VVWSIPYSANLTLRQFGLTLLLAGFGVRSGYTLLATLTQTGGLTILLAAAVVSFGTPLLVLWIGYRCFKLPFAVVTGMVSAVHTQPAVQAAALTQARNDLPNHGYALAFPMATIAKILLARSCWSLFCPSCGRPRGPAPQDDRWPADQRQGSTMTRPETTNSAQQLEPGGSPLPGAAPPQHQPAPTTGPGPRTKRS